MVYGCVGLPLSQITEREVVVCHVAVWIEIKGLDQVFVSEFIVTPPIKNTGNVVVDMRKLGIYG
jgi:hypothetical protein